MTVDIGGGTTDVSIVEYGDTQEGGGVNLEAMLLFRDSGSVAGDALTKEIIESVLLPTLGDTFQDGGEPADALSRISSTPRTRMPRRKPNGRAWSSWSSFRIVRQWLKDLAEDRYGSPGDRVWLVARPHPRRGGADGGPHRAGGTQHAFTARPVWAST